MGLSIADVAVNSPARKTGSGDNAVVEVIEGLIFNGDLELILFAFAAAVFLWLQQRKQIKSPNRARPPAAEPGRRAAASAADAGAGAGAWAGGRWTLAAADADAGVSVGATPPAADKRTPKAMSLERLVAHTIEMRIPTVRALDGYAELRRTGRHVTLEADLAAAKAKYSAAEFYAALVQCAGRGGFPESVGSLLDDMVDAGLERSLSIYESAMR